MFDYKKRVRRLQAKLVENDLGGAVLFRPEHIYYFGGFWGYWPWRFIGMIIPTSGEPVFFCPAIEQAYARASTWVEDLRVYVEWQGNAPQDPFDMIVDVLREKRLTRRRLGMEGTYLPANMYEQFRGVVAGGLVDIENLCFQIRSIKDAAEIELIRQGGQVVVAQAKAAVESLRPGVAEYEISLAVKEAGTRAAAQLLGPDERLFSPMIDGIQILSAEARRATWVHSRTTTYRLRSSDVVYMCFCMNANYKGYQLGFDRTAPVGKVSPEHRRVLEAVLASQDAAFAKARPGELASNVDAAAIEVMHNAGILEHRLHRTGRGVGVAPVEPPILTSSDESSVLQPGMTLCISPGAYIPNFGNAHIGDTILITEEGHERLTPFPGNLWDMVS